MQLFIIRNDGEVHELDASGKTIGDSLDPSESYILNDDDTKTIYLWKGKSCSVRSKFIGASKSQEVRGQVGMHYKVIPVDEGSEPKELLDKFGETPTTGHMKEIREEKDLQFDVPGVNSPSGATSRPKPKPKPQSPRPTGQVVGGGPTNGAKQVMSPSSGGDNAGPLYTGGTADVGPPQEKYDFKKIMETLESLETPAGYERELIIIGSQAFSIIEKRVNFLGTTKVEKSMEKMGNLPEGVFLAKNYSPRVLCENQQILAIEFLKKIGSEDGFSSSQDTQKLKRSSKDPRELAKSFGMKVE